MKKKIIAVLAGLGLLTAGFAVYKLYKDLDNCLDDENYFDFEDEEPAACKPETAECKIENIQQEG